MIKNLLFDLGGVIMDIERLRCVRAFEAIGFADANNYLGEYSQSGSFAALESGLVTPEEWRADIRKHISGDVTDQQIDNAFMAFLIGIPASRLEALRKLREKYNIYMLSNTNKVMWDSKIKTEFEKEGMTREDYFDGIVTSFNAKAMKPDPSIFEYAEKHLGIRPGETLFLDDSEKNCDAARRLGWQAFCVTPGTEFTTILSNLK